MIEILFGVLLLLMIFVMIFVMLLIITYIVNSLIKEWTVYHDIADMIKAGKGVPCRQSSLYGDRLCCGNCNSYIESDYKVCPNCHYRIIIPEALRSNNDRSHHDDICMDGVAG